MCYTEFIFNPVTTSNTEFIFNPVTTSKWHLHYASATLSFNGHKNTQGTPEAEIGRTSFVSRPNSITFDIISHIYSLKKTMSPTYQEKTPITCSRATNYRELAIVSRITDRISPILIIRIKVYILSIEPQGTYFIEMLFEIEIFPFTKMRLNLSSAKWWSFCPGGDELKVHFSNALLKLISGTLTV